MVTGPSFQPLQPSRLCCCRRLRDEALQPGRRPRSHRFLCFRKVTWKAKCPIFKAIVAGFWGKFALKNRTLGVPGSYLRSLLVSTGP